MTFFENTRKPVVNTLPKHFKDPVTHQFNKAHGELLVLYPDEWTAKTKEVCISEEIFYG